MYKPKRPIVDNPQLSGSAIPLDSRDKVETSRGCLVVLQRHEFATFIGRVVYTSNFSYLTTFIYHVIVLFKSRAKTNVALDSTLFYMNTLQSPVHTSNFQVTTLSDI